MPPINLPAALHQMIKISNFTYSYRQQVRRDTTFLLKYRYILNGKNN